MKWPNKLVIVRHAESERNLERERIEKFDSTSGRDKPPN